eukprot:scaffold16341_cov44-Prasinocladus_malaysianus.AAC.1
MLTTVDDARPARPSAWRRTQTPCGPRPRGRPSPRPPAWRRPAGHRKHVRIGPTSAKASSNWGSSTAKLTP